MKKLIERWMSELPDFWRKVRNIAITLAASCTAVFLANNSMNLQLPAVLITVCKYGIAVGAATGVNAQLTKKDNEINS